MIAYKGFNKDLTCTMGRGRYQYEVGKTYKEDKAKCVGAGFHCVEEPIEVLRWYPDGRFCVVDASGDINEDGDDKIACTEMTVIKEVSLKQLGALECQWIMEHPDRKASRQIQNESGKAWANRIVIVRGKNPRAAGELGATIFLLKEEKGSSVIAEAGAFEIDGQEYMQGIYYRVDGRRARCRKAN